MTLPAYSRSKEGEGQELGFGVRNGSHTARSRPARATRESSERACPATLAQRTARCASRGQRHGHGNSLRTTLFPIEHLQKTGIAWPYFRRGFVSQKGILSQIGPPRPLVMPST